MKVCGKFIVMSAFNIWKLQTNVEGELLSLVP